MKYRRGSVWRVLQAEGVFGEKIARDSVWNILINNKGCFFFGINSYRPLKNYFVPCLSPGLRDTNVEGDLVVEHYNNIFKVGNFAFFWLLYSFYKGIYN